MYESPITIKELCDRAFGSWQTHVENGIMKTLEYRYDIVVDKEELLRALEYDREQYDAGYHDGYIKGLDEGYAQAKEDIYLKLQLLLEEKRENEEDEKIY